MKTKFTATLLFTGLLAFSALAAEPATEAPVPAGPPDKEKISYAMGMHLGAARKESTSSTDVETFEHGLKDGLVGKPTLVKESEITELLNRARASSSDTPISKGPKPDDTKVSYAAGLRTGLQIFHTGVEVNPDTVLQGLNDVLLGKPTKLQEDEINPLFRQAQAYELVKRGEKNRTEGMAFLAKHAKETGVTVLPDGLQYKVLKTGTGPIPKPDDIVIVSYRGTLINGTEIEKKDNIVVRALAPIKGISEALKMMKAGSKWQLVIPADLAYGHQGMQMLHVDPDTTVIYELEYHSIAPPLDQLNGQYGLGTGRMGHGAQQFTAPPGVVGGGTKAPATDVK